MHIVQYKITSLPGQDIPVIRSNIKQGPFTGALQPYCLCCFTNFLMQRVLWKHLPSGIFQDTLWSFRRQPEP